MTQIRGWQRLGRLAEPLSPVKAPHHVDAPCKGHPSPGWYWQPRGATHETYLGYNHIYAETALLTLLGRQNVDAE
jgi:hypothetical protein